MLNEAFLDEYRARAARLEVFRVQLDGQLSGALRDAGVETQFVASRLKSPESLRHKLGRPDKTYQALWEVTDLIGLRVVTYFEDAIEEVARIVESHFEVDFAHSTERDRFDEQGRFGYRSVHYVCVAPALFGLPPEARFEIQVRSALQHAWAEVEHDLGYKVDAANSVVPAAVRRRFSRVASLLEIADGEFVAIRKELASYRSLAEERLRDPGRSFPLDVVTLVPVVKDPLTAQADGEVAKALQLPLEDALFFPEYLVKMLRHAGLSTTQEVLAALDAHRKMMGALVAPYFDFARDTWPSTTGQLTSVARGYSLFFLVHALILTGPGLELARVTRLSRMYRELDYPDSEREAQRVASGLAAALRVGLI